MSRQLKPGDKAPAFQGQDQNGNTVALSDFKGEKLALFFYPKDDTPTCTKEACNLRDSYPELRKAGVSVLGISIDNQKMHKKFETKYQLPFPLIADTEKKIVNLYGVWGWKQFMGRTFEGTHRVTFLINEKGIVDHIIDKVKSGNHAGQILELWK